MACGPSSFSCLTSLLPEILPHSLIESRLEKLHLHCLLFSDTSPWPIARARRHGPANLPKNHVTATGAMQWSVVLTTLSYVTSTVAQGSYGGAQTSCSSSASNAWQFVNCYQGDGYHTHADFTWQLSTSSSNAQSYPNYGSSSSLTVEVCQTACRGHGFKYSALWSGTECYCSASLPNPQPPTSGNTTSGPGTTFNLVAAPNNCNAVCPANSTETCGGQNGAQVYLDASFGTGSSAGAYSNYKYLGCFNNGNAGPMYVTIATSNTINCVTYCGKLGYAFASRSGIDSQSGGTNCGCGSEIQAGLEIAESSCSNNCDGTTGT